MSHSLVCPLVQAFVTSAPAVKDPGRRPSSPDAPDRALIRKQLTRSDAGAHPHASGSAFKWSISRSAWRSTFSAL